MGVRGRLLALAFGVGIPLAVLGALALWQMWSASRRQLADSVKHQAELAAVALAGWIDVQREPLATLAAKAGDRAADAELRSDLRLVASTRPHWVDVRILDGDGDSAVMEPPGAEPLRAELKDRLLGQMRRRSSWAVVTDWSDPQTGPRIAIGVPIESGGAVVARVEGKALGGLFRDLELLGHAVIAVFDASRRTLYRSSAAATYVGADVSASALFDAYGERCTAIVEADSPYDGVPRVYGLACAAATECVVAVGVPRAAVYEPARRQLMMFAIFSLLALACAGASAVAIARGIASPVRRLREAAQRLGAGDFRTRPPVRGPREIAELGAAFEAMAEQIADRETRLAELDRMKSEFVSSVSHELRTPLTTIKTLTGVLLSGNVTDAERREYLGTIAVECNREIELVLNLLDLSRIEAGTLTLAARRVDVEEVLGECLRIGRLAARECRHDLRVDVAPELPPVSADPAALRRVVCGLIENAIKYTPEGGRITVACSRADGDVAISVADTGIGIPPEDLQHVFEKFYRARRPATPDDDGVAGVGHGCTEAAGLGLGLYLARRILDQLGGRILAESVAGRGSRFTVHVQVWSGPDGEESPTKEAGDG